MGLIADKKATYYQGSSGPASVTGTPPMPASRKITPRVGPNGRMMVKSYSQDAASNMGSVAASAVAATTASPSTANIPEVAAGMTTSVSETLLQTVTSTGMKSSNLSTKPPLPKSTSASSVASSSQATSLSGEQVLAPSASSHSLRPPTVEEESHSAASDSGSVASELDSAGKKSKKKRSFFNFRRKKEKIP